MVQGMSGNGALARADAQDAAGAGMDEAALAEFDRRLVLATQGGLPLVPRPYAALAETLGVAEGRVRERLAAMLADGRIRRIGAVPNHYAIGYTANGMSVWDVPDERIDELGVRVGGLDFVTHCYHRPRRLPEWPYNLFAMVHGGSRTEVLTKVMAIAEIIGTDYRSHDVLFSTAILKKTGMRMAVRRDD